MTGGMCGLLPITIERGECSDPPVYPITIGFNGSNCRGVRAKQARSGVRATMAPITIGDKGSVYF